LIETKFEIGELVWFTFDGAVPRLGVVSAITNYYQVLFGDEKYWIPPHHISKHDGI
jgi:hypothetical protein